ncbi:methyltransferase family protein [Mycobacterium sp.]|uniref:methyltransferase family protein n=1 Tax=Mycobacterium sp. TaxID=1785 RepID=UPI002D87FDD2|nr:isoprenylcysteine carboxylmethyltransferase family protein [Mycobacterium sp.]
MNSGLKAIASSVLGFVYFGVLLFLPAGTFDYWQAWVFIAVFTATTAGPSIYWAVKRPEVLRRRMNAGPLAEARPAQKIIVTSVYLLASAMFVISALDHRFGWSQVPTAVVLIGDVLVAVGLGLAMLVVQQNSYAAATITVESEQQLVSTGLYGLVRHPMYSGALIMMIGTPLALDSYWGLVALIPSLVVLAFRILDEEKALTQELTGYVEYTQQVHHRLVPGVW